MLVSGRKLRRGVNNSSISGSQVSGMSVCFVGVDIIRPCDVLWPAPCVQLFVFAPSGVKLSRESVVVLE